MASPLTAAKMRASPPSLSEAKIGLDGVQIDLGKSGSNGSLHAAPLSRLGRLRLALSGPGGYRRAVGGGMRVLVGGGAAL